MATYAPSPIINPQFIPAVMGALTFKPGVGGLVVPAGFSYQITRCSVVNIGGGGAVSLGLWRVPAGSVADYQHVIIPVTVTVPTASSSAPWFDVGELWGAVLLPGDSIWAVAGAANVLAINADGVVIQ